MSRVCDIISDFLLRVGALAEVERPSQRQRQRGQGQGGDLQPQRGTREHGRCRYCKLAATTQSDKRHLAQSKELESVVLHIQGGPGPDLIKLFWRSVTLLQKF